MPLSHRRSRSQGLKAHERRTGFLLLVPALIAFTAVILWPFLQSLRLSLYKFTIEMEQPKFVGLQNFARILNDPGTLTVWLNTLVFVVVTTGLTFVMGLAWALMMNQSFKGRGFLRAASLLPWVLPTTVTAFLAAWIFNGQYGVLNAVLVQTGLISEPITWLAEQKGAMAADQGESAQVDGCENAGVLRYVILPHLAPTMIIVTILGAMGNLQAFDVIYAMTQGGPIKATTMLSVEVYKQAFQNWDMGTACAVGVLWFVTIAIPTVFYLRILFKREG